MNLFENFKDESQSGPEPLSFREGLLEAAKLCFDSWKLDRAEAVKMSSNCFRGRGWDDDACSVYDNVV